MLFVLYLFAAFLLASYEAIFAYNNESKVPSTLSTVYTTRNAPDLDFPAKPALADALEQDDTATVKCEFVRSYGYEDRSLGPALSNLWTSLRNAMIFGRRKYGKENPPNPKLSLWLEHKSGLQASGSANAEDPLTVPPGWAIGPHGPYKVSVPTPAPLAATQA